MNNKRSDIELAWRKQFGDRLKRLIRINGMTQGEFAAVLDIQEASLSRYITGVSSPSPYRVKQMADALGCDIALFFDDNF